jgi:hemoglobin/transferrin/lactoferrin receptor protein
VTTVNAGDILPDGRRAGGSVEAGHHGADDATHAGGIFAARAGGLEWLLAWNRIEGHEVESAGTNGGTGAARTLANPQDTRATSRLAKVTLPGADGGHWRATYEDYERRVATDVLSLNPQSPRTVSLAGDDRARRERASVDAVAYALGPVDRLTVLAYGQRSSTVQDTVEVRANTTAACLSAAGTLSCRREARFRLDQDDAGLSIVGESAPGAHRLVYGLDASRGEVSEVRDGRQVRLDTGEATNVVGTDVFPTRDFPRSRLSRLGAFVQDEVAWGGATWIPALRYDRFSTRPEPDGDFTAANPGRTPVSTRDDAWSPKLGVRVPLAAGLEATFQAATGFRAPPFFDTNVGLSSLPLGYAVIPNPDLRPETSRGFEAGLRGRHGAWRWSFAAHRTDYEDLIVSRAPLPCPGDPRCVATAPITFQSQNVTRARIEGLEARAEAVLAAGWKAGFGAAASRGDDLGRGAPLNSVDPAKAVASLAWEGAWLAGRAAGAELHLTHAARKTRIDARAGPLFATPAATVADLTAFAVLARGVTLTVGVFNLADRKYWAWTDVRGVANPGGTIDRYSRPGRSVSASIRVAL